MLPAPVAPEQGTALSTTATETSDPIRNCRAMVNPIIPAPIITTSKERDSADIGCDPENETGSGRVVILVALDTNLEPRKKLFLVPNSLFEYETTPFEREIGFGFGQQKMDEAEKAIFFWVFFGRKWEWRNERKERQILYQFCWTHLIWWGIIFNKSNPFFFFFNKSKIQNCAL